MKINRLPNDVVFLRYSQKFAVGSMVVAEDGWDIRVLGEVTAIKGRRVTVCVDSDEGSSKFYFDKSRVHAI